MADNLRAVPSAEKKEVLRFVQDDNFLFVFAVPYLTLSPHLMLLFQYPFCLSLCLCASVVKGFYAPAKNLRSSPLLRCALSVLLSRRPGRNAVSHRVRCDRAAPSPACPARRRLRSSPRVEWRLRES